VLEAVAIYVATGLLAGFVSGLFGVGGAFTMTPALIIALPLQGIADSQVMHLTAGTALAVMATTSAYVTVLRFRVGDLHVPLAARFVPFIAAGALGGALIADAMPGIALKIIFIGFVSLAIVRGIFHKHHASAAGGSDLTGIRGPGLWAHGTVTGITGALLGPGPAVIIGPYLRGARCSMPVVAATCSALACLLGFAAAGGYIYGGFNEAGLPASSLGYLYLPAFAGLAVGALAGSPFGIHASHKIADILLHRMFIGYLAFILAVTLTQLG
jgi:uncharacterized membrane protein YfcA